MGTCPWTPTLTLVCFCTYLCIAIASIIMIELQKLCHSKFASSGTESSFKFVPPVNHSNNFCEVCVSLSITCSHRDGAGTPGNYLPPVKPLELWVALYMTVIAIDLLGTYLYVEIFKVMTE